MFLLSRYPLNVILFLRYQNSFISFKISLLLEGPILRTLGHSWDGTAVPIHTDILWHIMTLFYN